MIRETDCPSRCSAVGDPHYVTFDGHAYTFNGDCSYRLARETTNDEFEVSAENVPCGSTGVTCTKSVQVRAFGKIFQLLHGYDVRVNNDTFSSRPSTTIKDQVEISKDGLFIKLDFTFGLTVLWDGGWYCKH